MLKNGQIKLHNLNVIKNSNYGTKMVILSKNQRIVLIKGTKENDEDNDNMVNITRTKEGAIFFTNNKTYEDENFIYFYPDQIKDLIKTLNELVK